MISQSNEVTETSQVKLKRISICFYAIGVTQFIPIFTTIRAYLGYLKLKQISIEPIVASQNLFQWSILLNVALVVLSLKWARRILNPSREEIFQAIIILIISCGSIYSIFFSGLALISIFSKDMKERFMMNA